MKKVWRVLLFSMILIACVGCAKAPNSEMNSQQAKENSYQIGIGSGAGNRWGENRYKKLKEMGYDYLDFNMCNTDTAYYTGTQEERDAAILAEKELIDEADLVVHQVHGPFRWPICDGTEAERAERMEKMKWSLRNTYLLECEYWVIHPIMPFDWQERITNPGCEQQTWDINLAFFKELLVTAKEYGITICLENMPMPDFSIGSAEEILRFVQEMNDENFKVCFDTGHAAVYENQNVGDAIRLLGDEIRVLHVNDNDGKGDRHWLPYEGVVDWEDVTKALKDINYQGVFNYEATPSADFADADYERMCLTMIKMAKTIID